MLKPETIYYFVAGGGTVLTIAFQAWNAWVAQKIKNDLADFKEWSREKFVEKGVCKERHDNHDSRISSLEVARFRKA